MEARYSSNIGEDRRVVLTALREVPEEITFLLSEAEQDQSIKNRYWFDFPNQWSNQPNKDPIIGIRSIYTTNTNRFIKFSYKVELIPLHETSSIDTIEGTIKCWLNGSDTIEVITRAFNEWWLKDGTRTTELTDEEHEWKDWEIQAYYGYDRQTHKTNLCFGRGILESSTILVIDSEDFDVECSYYITITPLSDDAMALFNTASALPTTETRVEIPMWSRHQCFVKSSIANNDKNNILGHTRNDPYTPLKYYRLNNGLKKFWIELYETRNHDCPVVFAKKIYEDDEEEKKKIDRDDLIIEAIVCFTAQAMI